jgi:hypothetical protein
MQAVGMVNDHTTNCFRWKECQWIESRFQISEELANDEYMPAS